MSGFVIADGRIDISSNVVICGSEGYNEGTDECNPLEDSYVLLLSESASLDPASPAISMQSNASTALLYSDSGMVRVGSKINIKEATCYACQINSNATISYDSGLINLLFTTGPSGGMVIKEWKEI